MTTTKNEDFVTGRLAAAMFKKTFGVIPVIFDWKITCPNCGAQIREHHETVPDVTGPSRGFVESLDKMVKEIVSEALRRAREAHHGAFQKRCLEVLKDERERDPSISVRALDEKVGEILNVSWKTVQRVRLDKKSRGQIAKCPH